MCVINIYTAALVFAKVEVHLCSISFTENRKSFERKTGYFRGYSGVSLRWNGYWLKSMTIRWYIGYVVTTWLPLSREFQIPRSFC